MEGSDNQVGTAISLSGRGGARRQHAPNCLSSAVILIKAKLRVKLCHCYHFHKNSGSLTQTRKSHVFFFFI